MIVKISLIVLIIDSFKQQNNSNGSHPELSSIDIFSQEKSLNECSWTEAPQTTTWQSESNDVARPVG